MAGALFGAAARRSASASAKPEVCTDTTLRFTFGQGTGFIKDQRVESAGALQGVGITHQHAKLGGASTPEIIDIGVARPSAQGQR